MPPTDSPTTRLRDLSLLQWKSGIAAWMGWFFDGLDIHLYTLVAAPFVAHLLNVADTGDPLVKKYSSWIQASFLIGWALGGGIFGRLGDRIGRSRALSLTILTYAAFTGLSFFAHTWWELLIFRFVSALGIGGEWAVGACLLSETWPKRWGPWIAAVLQCGVNVGILCACFFAYILAAYPPRYLFLIGIIPALIVFWIRRHVPEPAEWQAAQTQSTEQPRISDLFRGKLAVTTLLTAVVCSLTLTGWWAFLFWNPQHLQSLPELAGWSPAAKRQLVTKSFFLVIFVSMAGNYFVSWLATFFGYRKVILAGSLAFAASFYWTYHVPRGYEALMFWLPVIGFWSGIFGLFTMYLPPLFPTLLRTTGAGFCFNIGRIAAAIGTVIFGLSLHGTVIFGLSLHGTVIFGLSLQIGDFRRALMSIAALFVLAAFVSYFLPESE